MTMLGYTPEKNHESHKGQHRMFSLDHHHAQTELVGGDIWSFFATSMLALCGSKRYLYIYRSANSVSLQENWLVDVQF
jgi:hypothetical protein